MKASKFPKERGQALVIIAFAAVALFAFAALAIDGGRVFSDRRHSQNASDTAVLAAALAKIREDNNWQTVGLTRAAENDYNDADTETEVFVLPCDTSHMPYTSDNVQVKCKGLPTGADPKQYIVVHIKSVVHMTFARIIGRYTIINHTDAVSRATEPEITNWYDGYGIASTHQGCWPNQNSVPFDLGGSSTTFVKGAGVLVSAVCPGDSSVNVSGNPSLSTTTGVCAPGADVPSNDQDNLGNPGLQSTCNVPPPDYYTLPPDPECKNDGTIDEPQKGSGTWIATPGKFTSTFPDVKGGQAKIILQKGIYCLENGINLGAGWDITTDWNGNNSHDAAGEGVFFYVSGGDVEFNGNAFAFLHAISSTTNKSWEPYLNYLMYIPLSNKAEVHITGGSGSVFTGTILAPSSKVTLQGSTDNLGGNVTLDAQIIADIVKITGNTDLTIVYNKSNNGKTLTNPGIQLIE